MIASAASSVMGGVAANNAGKANQAIAMANARNARVAKDNETKTAAWKAHQVQVEGSRLIGGAAQDVLGTGGVEMSGSPVVSLGEMAAQVKMKEMMEIYGGEVKSNQLENEARMFEYRGALARQQGKQQFGMSMLGAAVAAGGTAYSMGAFSSAPQTFATTPHMAKSYGGTIGSYGW